MKRNLEIGAKIYGWSVISEPIIKNGKKHRYLKCDCGKEQLISESYINKSFFSKSCRSCSQIRRRDNDSNKVYSVGDIYMNLKIKKIFNKPLSYVVECINCGFEYHTGHSVLNKKKNGKGLFCCHNCFNVDMKSKKRFTMITKNISLSKYKILERQANLRGIEFNVSAEYLESIYNGFCYFSGIEIKIGTHSFNKLKQDLGLASLDRLNSNIGYVEGNVVWVHKDINTMKHILSVDDFMFYCKKVIDHSLK